MKVAINYKDGSAFEVEADDEETLELLTNYALKILWPKTSKALTLDEMDEWLGWNRSKEPQG